MELSPELLPFCADCSDREQTLPDALSSLGLGDNKPLAVTQHQAYVLLNHRDLMGFLALAVLFSGMPVFLQVSKTSKQAFIWLRE